MSIASVVETITAFSVRTYGEGYEGIPFSAARTRGAAMNDTRLMLSPESILILISPDSFLSLLLFSPRGSGCRRRA